MVGLAREVAGRPGGGSPSQAGVGRGAARRGKDTRGLRAHFTRAALAPATTTQGDREQEVVYAFREEMTLKAAEAIKMALDEGAACRANRAYHVHPHTGDTWHSAFPGKEGMEGISALPECERQGNEVRTLARVAEKWVREAGGAERVTEATWKVGPSGSQGTAGDKG